MPEYTFLELSTSHISAKDASRLTDGIDGLLYDTYDEGYFIYVPGEPTDIVETITHLENEEFSRELSILLLYAHSHGHKILRLDRDADIDPQFERFEW